MPMLHKDECLITPVIFMYPKNTYKKIWISNYGNMYEHCSEAYTPNGYDVNGFELSNNYHVFVNDKPFSETIIKKIEAYFEISNTVHAIPHISNIHHIIQTLILEEKVEKLSKIIEGLQSNKNIEIK